MEPYQIHFLWHPVIDSLVLPFLPSTDHRSLRLVSHTARSAIDATTTKLSADFDRVNTTAFVRLTMAPCWHSLTTLSMMCCRLSAAEAGFLSRAPGLGHQLQHVHLSYNRLGDGGAAALAQAFWPNLKSLSVASNTIGPEGAAALAAAPHWKALKELSLQANQIGDEGVAALCNPCCTWKTSMQSLDLSFNLLTAQAARSLAAAGFPLRCLALSANPKLGDDGAGALASASWSQTIKILRLDLSGVGIEGVRALAAGPFVKLRLLSLYTPRNAHPGRAKEVERVIKEAGAWRGNNGFQFQHLVI